MNAPNLYSREIPLGPMDLPVYSYFSDPVQVRAMDKEDIRNFRKWHRDAAMRAKRAGFDIIYVYAGKLFGLPMYFLSRRFNQRTDEYGGSLENRARLLKELIEDTKDAVGDTCAVRLPHLGRRDGGRGRASMRRKRRTSSAIWPNCPTSGT